MGFLSGLACKLAANAGKIAAVAEETVLPAVKNGLKEAMVKGKEIKAEAVNGYEVATANIAAKRAAAIAAKEDAVIAAGVTKTPTAGPGA